MDDIDYGEMRNSELVKAMRCLAMVVICLEEVIEEPGVSAGGCGGRPAEAAVDEQSLKAAMQASSLLGERRSGQFSAILEVKQGHGPAQRKLSGDSRRDDGSAAARRQYRAMTMTGATVMG